jgi:hypothetical protein
MRPGGRQARPLAAGAALSHPAEGASAAKGAAPGRAGLLSPVITYLAPMKTNLTVLQVHRILLPDSPPAKRQNHAFFGQLQD